MYVHMVYMCVHILWTTLKNKKHTYMGDKVLSKNLIETFRSSNWTMFYTLQVLGWDQI